MKEYRRVARTLCASFERDPFVNYILNTEVNPSSERDRKHKQDLMVTFFEFSVYECFSYGGTVVVVKDVSLEADLVKYGLRVSEINKLPFLAAACWIKLESDNHLFDYPSRSFSNLHPSSLKFNLFASLAKCRSRILKELFPRLKQTRDEVLLKLHLSNSDCVWYLEDIGVLPSCQGHGLAKRLINHVLETYVRANAWCYLESSNLANRKFYEKLGFSVASTFVINDDEDDLVYMDAMVKH